MELVTDFIIERKKCSDLAASIVDGRYSEQKLRLQQCPCRRVTYIVEGDLARQDILSPAALVTALSTTRVVDGFHVERTASTEATIAYLTHLHRHLEGILRTAGLTNHGDEDGDEHPVGPFARFLPRGGIRYEAFAESAKKKHALTARQIFGSQLRQIHGCGAPRAEAILARFPTPRSLVEWSRSIEPAARINALEDLPVFVEERGGGGGGKGGRRLGRALAMTVCRVIHARGEEYG